MKEQEFTQRYIEEKDSYLAWGHYIQDTVISALHELVDIKSFIKVPVEPRVKEVSSLIQKAFYRNKKYQNPYDDITDKVGIRFVVLSLQDIDVIGDIIQSSKNWTFSLDRNFEQERKDSPNVFTYQSVHYVLRALSDFRYKDVLISKNTPCEVQIRTLLQHSYSELTHDTIYKGKTIAVPDVHRKIARSMALIEATDELFVDVNNLINDKQGLYDNYIKTLSNIYSSIIPSFTLSKDFNLSILDAYQDIISQQHIENIVTHVSEPSALEIYKQIINTNYEKSLLFRQPIIMFLFYIVSKEPYTAIEHWPFPEKQLENIANSIGRSIFTD